MLSDFSAFENGIMINEEILYKALEIHITLSGKKILSKVYWCLLLNDNIFPIEKKLFQLTKK